MTRKGAKLVKEKFIFDEDRIIIVKNTSGDFFSRYS